MSRPRIRRLFRAAAILLLLFAAAGYGLQRWVNSASVHRRLTARLERAFGRAVEVDDYTIQWLPFIGIEADRVTIAEDPRFGRDYLLRADSVVAAPRWTSLILGRLELGTIRFNQPSLNVIRTADGRWNLESWLPTPAQAAAIQSNAAPHRESSAASARLRRIEVEDGRVDFRSGNEVRPFALTGIVGSLEQGSPGRWQVDLTAVPHRPTVKLQDSGTLRVTGAIAGTSARLQPAEVTVTWSDASVADALRLALGHDSGVRGTMQLQFSAATSLTAPPFPAPAQWNFTFAAQFANLHSWDLPLRTSDPQISLRASGGWQAGTPQLDVREILLESEHSRVLASGSLDWRSELKPEFTVAPSQIAWNDLLDAYRSFTPGVADGLLADGMLSLHGGINGFSRPEISLEAETDRIAVRRAAEQLFEADNFALNSANDASSLSFLLRWKPAQKSGTSNVSTVAGKVVPESPSELSVFASLAPQAPGQLVMRSNTIERRITMQPPPKYIIRVDGKLDHTEAWLDAARAIGKPLNSGWDAAGGLELHLAWEWLAGEGFPRPSGMLTARNFNVRFPLINQPIELADAKLVLDSLTRRVTVARASAFGARWQGTISWQQATAPLWQFDLAANQLDADELDRWLGPRARPGFIARLFSSEPTPRVIPPAPDTVRARGRLRVASFSVAPLAAQNLQADLELDGRVLTAQHVQAQLYGGNVTGALEAKLAADPAYRFTGRADNVNLGAATAGSPELARRFSGAMSGNIEFSGHGIGREQLLASLEGRGRFAIAAANLAGFDFNAPPVSAAPSTGAASSSFAHFSSISSGFLVSRRSIEFDHLALAAPGDTYQGSGRMNFTRQLDLSLQPASAPAPAPTPVAAKIPAPAAPAPAIRQIHITGTLESPRVAVTGPAPHPAAPPAKRQTAPPASGLAQRR